MLGTLLTDGGGKMPRVFRWMGEIARHPIDFTRTLVPFGWAKRTLILLVMLIGLAAAATWAIMPK